MNAKNLVMVLLFIVLISLSLFSQQEVVLKITEGVPAISLALPRFVVHTAGPEASRAAEEIYQVLSSDLKYSRVFQLLPQSYYSSLRPLDQKLLFFTDWLSPLGIPSWPASQ